MPLDSIGAASDSQLLDIATQVITAMTADPTVYGATAAVVTDLTTIRNQFNSEFMARVLPITFAAQKNLHTQSYLCYNVAGSLKTYDSADRQNWMGFPGRLAK